MQVRDGLRLYSASDLVGYLECRHLTTLALTNLETPLERAVDDESAKLIQEMGYAHEGRYLEALRSAGLRIYEVADDGFATAIRLPLISEAARERIAAQFEWLRVIEAPVLLFLERISRITVEDSAAARPISLTRTVERTESIDKATELTWVRLSDSDAYLVTRRFLPDEQFGQVLAESVSRGEVPRSWERWKGEAAINVAVKQEGPPAKGRFYCFLPMGQEAVSPFPGHCNANFYTSLDRRSVNEKCRLNEYFIDGIAALCKDLARSLVRLEVEQFAQGVVDLISWDGPHTSRLINAFRKDASDLGAECLIPVESPSGGVSFEAFRKCWEWKDADYIALNSSRIAGGGGHVWATKLDASRRERLRRLGQWIVHSTEPRPSVVAEWVEHVAIQLRSESVEATVWENFLDDVAKRFAEIPAELAGRRILLAASGELVSGQHSAQDGAGGEAKSVYFPRARAEVDASSVGAGLEDSKGDGDSDVETIPAVLNDDFVFLSSLPTWPEGSRRRRFLREHKLVRDFDSRELLRSLSVITRSGERDHSHKTAALRMAFTVWKRGRADSGETLLGKNDFYLPAHDGWRIASSCTFGAGWGIPAATKLDRWISELALKNEGARAQHGQFLPQFSEWGIGESLEDWREFLKLCGVSENLAANAARLPVQSYGGYELKRRLETGLALTDAENEYWTSALGSRPTDLPNRNTEYRHTNPIFTLPIAIAWKDLSEHERVEFAAYLIRSLSSETKSQLAFDVFRPRKVAEQNRRQWPTPFSAFLSQAPWMPVQRA